MVNYVKRVERLLGNDHTMDRRCFGGNGYIHSRKSTMGDVNLGLSRFVFYSTWCVCNSGGKLIISLPPNKINSWDDVFKDKFCGCAESKINTPEDILF